MFFGSNDLRDVHIHLEGWRAHRRYATDKDSFADTFFEEFHGFVESHYDDHRTIGWQGLICEYEGKDKQFEKFMELVEKFFRQKVLVEK
ncbi:hypothetical protein [Ruegeria sp. HKCCD8929]|uniref:hypothetical protein n=1 Tax=Ruegeria sp. HKCCD8929 TaxID=2683006 RepID=UPI00148908F7|nr:hypothetical protein [Ruegeria sp. HKCCD8929]